MFNDESVIRAGAWCYLACVLQPWCTRLSIRLPVCGRTNFVRLEVRGQRLSMDCGLGEELQFNLIWF